jgi:hypothetical protein
MKTPWMKGIFLVLLAGGILTAGGCDMARFITAKTYQLWTPEEEIEAQYKLENMSVLVLVDIDDERLASRFPRLETSLVQAVNKVLTDHKACGPVVSPHSLDVVRKTEPKFKQMSVAQLGKYFNVDRVIYIQVLGFRLRDDPSSNMYHGTADAAVRVVSPEAGEQVWPVLSDAWRLSAETLPEIEADTVMEEESILVDGFGEKIARLFFTYKKEDIPLHPKVK